MLFIKLNLLAAEQPDSPSLSPLRAILVRTGFFLIYVKLTPPSVKKPTKKFGRHREWPYLCTVEKTKRLSLIGYKYLFKSFRVTG